MMGGFPKVFGYGAFKVLSSLWLTNGAPSLNGMDPPSKMVWLKMHEPEIWERTYKLLDVKDWLVHKSCGRFVTTADAANLTWMMDTRPSRNCWSPMLMSRFGISENLLPEIVPGNSSPGGLTKAASKALGLPEGLPVVAGCGDVCAAALGSGNVADGELHLSLGTSSWIGGFYPSRRLSATESYATILSPVDNRPLLIATQESAGSCLNWFERIGGKRLPVEAKPREQNAEPPLFLPWLAGERVPADDAKLRGAFLGLTLMHDTASMSRAVLEGVALNTRWAYRSVAQQRGTARSRRLRLVGGAAQNRSLCQDLADSLGVDLSVGPAPRMAGVQGAATIAGAALDFFPNTWEAATRLSQEEHSTYVPNPERVEYFNRRFDLFLDAHRRNAPWFRSFFLSELKPQ
jgi:xylulokinase